ncbi:MAG TPA: hypothetical protein VNL14_07870 [Candidatus Acidoferrales bacterium]|nr:hypothetical protein [Candidatus Acidoferrales bacterium]
MAFLKTLLVGLAGLFLLSLVSDAAAAERGRGGCRRGDRLRIQDLDMSPDPIVEGQRIRFWRVRLYLDGNRQCDTEVEIHEGKDVVARERISLRPGTNEVNIRPDERYRFHGREHCFTVVVDLEGSRRQVDADRRFCARQKPSWTMGEPGDRPAWDRR